MKTTRYCAVLVTFVAVCAALTFADEAGTHLAYLHALSALRDARAHLDRLTPSEPLESEEEHAIREIDAAISEIKPAAIDEGEDFPDHTPVDPNLGRDGRYHKALELLDRAHHDIAEKQDNQFAPALRYRALEHINEAYRILDHLTILDGNGVINVKAYGATGNGFTDDTVAINKAIAAISSSKTILYFPAGTYIVSSTLTLANPMHVLGDSQPSTVIYLASNSNCNVIDVTSSDVTFEQLTVNGNQPNQPDGNYYGISYATALSNLTLKSVTVTNASTGVFMLSASNVVVDGCTFSGSLGQQFGYEYTPGVNSSNVTIVNSRFDSTSITSPFVCLFFWPESSGGSLSKVFIRNNIVTFPQTSATEADGIVINGATDVEISDNVIESPAGERVAGQNGLELENVNGVTVSGNTFINQYNGIETQKATNSNLAVMGNVFIGGAASSSSSSFAIDIGGSIGATNINVVGNNISGHAGSINLANCNQAYVSRNTISVPNIYSSTGVSIEVCNDLVVSDNVISMVNSNSWGIVSSGSTEQYETYRRNILSGTGYGFLFFGTTYTACIVQGDTFDGISVGNQYYGTPISGVTILD